MSSSTAPEARIDLINEEKQEEDSLGAQIKRDLAAFHAFSDNLSIKAFVAKMKCTNTSLGKYFDFDISKIL